MRKMRWMEVHLPDEVLLEILVRVKDNPAALFRCAAVCKQWRSLIADSSFLRRCWPPGSAASCSFQGFFYRGNSTFLPRPTCFIPAPRSALGGGRRSLGSFFFPSAPAGLFDGAMLASRHGLLLLSGNLDARRLTVCNPVAGTYDLLPPLEWVPWIGHAIITGADCRRPPPYYKVLVVDTQLNVYMFSSDEASWSRKCFRPGADIINPYGSDAIVRYGTAHWLCYSRTAACLCTIDVDLETGHVSTKKFVTVSQRPHSRPHLSLAADGNMTLSVLWMRTEHFHVEIWKRQDKKDGIDGQDDDSSISTWHCTRVIELKWPDVEIRRNSFILGEKCGTLIVEDGLCRVYFAHMETGIMEEVMCCRGLDLAKGHFLAFEIDWLAFIVSRLGNR